MIWSSLFLVLFFSIAHAQEEGPKDIQVSRACSQIQLQYIRTFNLAIDRLVELEPITIGEDVAEEDVDEATLEKLSEINNLKSAAYLSSEARAKASVLCDLVMSQVQNDSPVGVFQSFEPVMAEMRSITKYTPPESTLKSLGIEHEAFKQSVDLGVSKFAEILSK